MDTTIAKRLLLSTIAPFALLAGSILAAGLFQRHVIEQPHQSLQLESLADVCRAELVLHLPEPLADYARTAKDHSDLRGCSIKMYKSGAEPTSGAIVYGAEQLLEIDVAARNYVVLKEPFGKGFFFVVEIQFEINGICFKTKKKTSRTARIPER